MKNSIDKNGLLQPVTAWRPPDHEDYELIAGERRLRACEALGQETIDAIVRDDVTEQQVLTLTLIENVQRVGLSPLEEAESFARLIALTGMTAAAVAAEAGKSAEYVRARLQLTFLVDEAKVALRNRALRTAPALMIARLVESDQREILPWAVKPDWRGALPTAAEVERQIEGQFFLRLASAPFDPNDPSLHPDFLTRPEDPTLTCSGCPRRTGASPELFPDLQQIDKCTNRRCFAAKRSAHVERVVTVQLERARAEGTKVLRVSDGYVSIDAKDDSSDRDPGTSPLAPRVYTIVHDDQHCDQTHVGVVVDGPRAGEVRKVCTNRRCPTHKGANLGRSYVQQERAKRKELDTERKVLCGVLGATLAKLPLENGPTLALDDLRLVVRRMAAALHAEGRQALAQSLDLDVPKVKKEHPGASTQYDGALASHVGTRTAPDLLRLLMRLALLDDAWPQLYDTREPNDLITVATRVGVDPSLIRAEVSQAEHIKSSNRNRQGKRRQDQQAA